MQHTIGADIGAAAAAIAPVQIERGQGISYHSCPTSWKSRAFPLLFYLKIRLGGRVAEN
jgi:hypothetical protein